MLIVDLMPLEGPLVVVSHFSEPLGLLVHFDWRISVSYNESIGLCYYPSRFFVDGGSVLDGIDAASQGVLYGFQAVGVGSNHLTHGVGFVDHDLQLFRAELSVLQFIKLRSGSSASHDFYEVGSIAKLLSHGSSAFADTVSYHPHFLYPLYR